MANDNNYSLYVLGEYNGTVESKKTGKKYYTFSLANFPTYNRKIWVKSDEYSDRIISDADPEKGNLFRIKVTAIPYNGTAFLGYTVVGVA